MLRRITIGDDTHCGFALGASYGIWLRLQGVSITANNFRALLSRVLSL